MIDEELRKQLANIQGKAGRPKETDQYKRSATSEGTAQDERRATYILTNESIEELKAIAKLTNRRIKHVAQEAINNFIKQHHNERGNK